MSFFKFEYKLYPLTALISAIFLCVFGLIEARNINSSYFLAAVFIWLCIFGCAKACLKSLIGFLIVGGIFFLITYYAYGKDINSAIAMSNRFASVFLAAAIGMSLDSVRVTRCLSGLHFPRSITLGMLIATSFVPVLKTEINRIKEAMKTRGAGTILKPKIFYRAFIVPFCMRLVNISDTLSLSIETRGFELGKVKYTIYKKEIFTFWDIVFLLGLITGTILVIIL